MDRKQTIAGVVLTLNEEHDLACALRSLSWCDDLLVVDSGSTDRTQEIAERCHARFVQNIQTPPFLVTEQRNWALDNGDITSDWVLFLDADEEVSSTLVQQILSAINSSDTFDAYELTPRYWFLGKWLKHTQGFPNWHPRLLRRGSTRFQGGVWESFSNSRRVGRLLQPYEHYAFSKGLDDWLDRHQRYSSWDAAEICTNLSKSAVASSYTTRKIVERRIMTKLWFLRPPSRFLQKYILQGGFTEGWQSLLFSLMMAFYDLMTVIKIIEIQRKQRGLKL